MIGVARHAIADELGINPGAARLGVLIGFKNDAAGALAHDETVAVPVIRPRGGFGLSLKPVESARQAANPAMPMRLIADSAPPATITSASSKRDQTRRVADGMGSPVEQAVTTAWFGPLRPCWIET